jgi:hypothetical protein
MRHRQSGLALLALATVLALIALGGCATVPPPFAPMETVPRDTVRSEPSTLMPTGKRIPAPAPVAVAPRSYAPADSVPSPEALAVLDSIPEPLAPEERFRARRRPAIAAIVDSSAIPIPAEVAPTAADSSEAGHAEAPVPAPTHPLGDRPGALERMLAADSAATADSSARARSSGAGAGPSGTASAPKSSAPDTCFRVQVGAPAEIARANQLRDAAASQLLVPMVVEKERGLYKVRTRDCYTRESADRLRTRAVGAGFKGVFRISGPRPGTGR